MIFPLLRSKCTTPFDATETLRALPFNSRTTRSARFLQSTFEPHVLFIFSLANVSQRGHDVYTHAQKSVELES